MTDHHMLLAIAAAAIVTAIIRAGPILFLAQRNFPVILRNLLAFVPTAVLSAIIAAEVISNKETTSFGLSVAFLATVVSFIAGALSRNLLMTVLASIFAYLLFQSL
ncbi:MAG: Azaleucine resistance protein AzlD [Candidatus Tokpelaia sp. JSC189]|nr:MAG: Azaleucine resistance protein AzlD [Candidatus Tokpelaia sp. JSC189]